LGEELSSLDELSSEEELSSEVELLFSVEETSEFESLDSLLQEISSSTKSK
jgi:hypothetical protein